jgi:A/G-specific adenine glycosylase
MQYEENKAPRPLAVVMAGLSRPKDGVASARLCPAIHVFVSRKEDVDARDKRGHDE